MNGREKFSLEDLTVYEDGGLMESLAIIIFSSLAMVIKLIKRRIPT